MTTKPACSRCRNSVTRNPRSTACSRCRRRSVTRNPRSTACSRCCRRSVTRNPRSKNGEFEMLSKVDHQKPVYKKKNRRVRDAVQSRSPETCIKKRRVRDTVQSRPSEILDPQTDHRLVCPAPSLPSRTVRDCHQRLNTGQRQRQSVNNSSICV